MPASGGEPSKIGGTQKSWSRIEGIEQTHGWPPAFRQVVIRASLGRTRARHRKPGVVQVAKFRRPCTDAICRPQSVHNPHAQERKPCGQNLETARSCAAAPLNR